MSLVTVAQVQDAIPHRTLIQLTQDEHHATEADMSQINRAIDTANNTIAGYLASRYDWPLAHTSAQLTEIAMSIVRHTLYMRRLEGNKDLPAAVVRMYDHAIAQLKAIQSGKASVWFDDTQANSNTNDGNDAVTHHGNAPAEPSKMVVKASRATFADTDLQGY